jgi:hypothetical protein
MPLLVWAENFQTRKAEAAVRCCQYAVHSMEINKHYASIFSVFLKQFRERSVSAAAWAGNFLAVG